MTTATATPNESRPKASALPLPSSLKTAASGAASRGQPLVVMTTLDGCPYCEVVRNNYLLPMLRAGEIEAVQIDVLDKRRNLQNFEGELVSPADQARAWKARFTPTVLFFDAQGREVAERLVGIGLPDFYGAYLDARLKEARARLR